VTNAMQPLGTRQRAVRIALALVIVLVPAVVATRAQAQTFTLLYSFTGGADGGTPYAGLIRDAKGNLYGATEGGGAYNCGTVFKLDNTGSEKVLHTFTGTGGDGKWPFAGLVRDAAGNLYGTTEVGGDLSGCSGSGCGVVFKLDKTGKETVLHTFTATGGDGALPDAGLVRDAAGNLYGTTEWGGTGSCYGPVSGCGTVFRVDKAGKETVLYSFTGSGGDGANPLWGYLVRDAAGNLYGTTERGGASDYGTVFRLDKTGKETVLYSFTGSGGDGRSPFAGLVRDAKGNVYGTNVEGGASGVGTVFRVSGIGKESVLYGFTGSGGDGSYPYAGLVRDAKGNLYGTTYDGGASGYGTVFMVEGTGKETVLHSFASSDGANPSASLVRDAKGSLYGTTVGGGAYGYGVVFELTP